MKRLIIGFSILSVLSFLSAIPLAWAAVNSFEVNTNSVSALANGTVESSFAEQLGCAGENGDSRPFSVDVFGDGYQTLDILNPLASNGDTLVDTSGNGYLIGVATVICYNGEERQIPVEVDVISTAGVVSYLSGSGVPAWNLNDHLIFTIFHLLDLLLFEMYLSVPSQGASAGGALAAPLPQTVITLHNGGAMPLSALLPSSGSITYTGFEIAPLLDESNARVGEISSAFMTINPYPDISATEAPDRPNPRSEREPVGGVTTFLKASSPGTGPGLLAALALGTVSLLIALGGGGWYAGQRWLKQRHELPKEDTDIAIYF